MGLYGKYNSIDEIPEDERKYYALGDKFRPIESIDFVEIMFNRRYKVKVPRFLHEYHGWWDDWEKERNLSMEEYLKPGMILYDVGAFDGWLSAVYSQFVGGSGNMVLIEPCKDQWPNTKITFEANGLGPPCGAFLGFLGNETRGDSVILERFRWPEGPDYSKALKGINFRLIHEHTDIPAAKLDHLRDYFPIPDAITIDVEGAEFEVLRGAEHVLGRYHPLVWVAIHDDFMRERHKTAPGELFKFMKDIGYTAHFLGYDHEEHWLFE